MTIQIEEGKFYRTRDGRKVGPYTHAFDNIWRVGGDHDTARFEDGTLDGDVNRPGDLVAEWNQTVEVDQAATAAAEGKALPDEAWYETHRADGSAVEDDGFVTVVPDIKAEIADEAKNIVSGARRSAYGKPERNFERIAGFWSAYAKAKGWPIEFSAADVSPMMRLMKEARLAETPDHRDSFVDLVGYTLTGAEVNGVKPNKS